MTRATTTTGSARTAPGARWVRFARGLLDRLAGAPAPARPLGLVFRRPSARAVWAAVDRRSWTALALLVAPRLELHLHRLLRERDARAAPGPAGTLADAARRLGPAAWLEPRRAARSGRAATAAPAGDVAERSAAPPALARALARAAAPLEPRRPALPEAHPALARLLSRTADAGALTARRAREEDPRLAAPPALFVREAATLDTAAGGGARAPGARSRDGAAPAGASGGPAPGVDLEQLTDRVVRQLDARLVAHRERVGRAF